MAPEANYNKAIKLQAKIATVVTAFSRIREGQEPVAPKKDLSYAANFLYMLSGKEPDEYRESKHSTKHSSFMQTMN